MSGVMRPALQRARKAGNALASAFVI